MIEFDVPGMPIPKGSAKAFMRKGARFPTVIQDNAAKQKPWASMIGLCAAQEMARTGTKLSTGAMSITVSFAMPRPKCHMNSKGNVRPNAPYHPVTKPDIDKLLRCVFDALTGIVWRDDSQVIQTVTTKQYGFNIGAKIRIEEIA